MTPGRTPDNLKTRLVTTRTPRTTKAIKARNNRKMDQNPMLPIKIPLTDRGTRGLNRNRSSAPHRPRTRLTIA